MVFERNRVRKGGREREERLLQEQGGQPSVGTILVLRGESEAPGKQARSTEPERHGRPVGGLAISSRRRGGRAKKIVLDQTDRELDLAASAAEPVVDLCAPPVLGEHASDESRIGANRIDPDPAEHAERTQIALGLSKLGRIVDFARLEQELATNRPGPSLDVQRVSKPRDPAALLGIEDVAPLELDGANDGRAGIGEGGGVGGILRVERKGVTEHHGEQSARSTRQRSIATEFGRCHRNQRSSATLARIRSGLTEACSSTSWRNFPVWTSHP